MTAKKGFTLIELLIVIAILGVLAAGVITAINPGKRMRQAADTALKNNLGQYASALQAYYTSNQFYPAIATWGTLLQSSGDLKVVPAATYIYNRTGTCTATSGSTCEVSLYVLLQEPVLAASPALCWRSALGTVVETTVALCVP